MLDWSEYFSEKTGSYFDPYKFNWKDYVPDPKIMSNGIKSLWNELYEKPDIIEVSRIYMPDFVLGMTDTVKKIWLRDDLGYMEKPFVLAHELVHCLRRQKGKNQDEREVDLEAMHRLGLAYNPVR